MKKINFLSLELAFSFLKAKHKEKSLSIMIYICFFGIFIGSFSLMLTLIITNGFEKTISEKMQGINASIIINSPDNKIDINSLRPFLLNKYNNEIKGVSGCMIRQVIINKNDKQFLIFLKGIEPSHERIVTNIESKITSSITPNESPNLENLLNNNSIIIGYKIAESFNLKVGDQLKLLIPQASSKGKINLERNKVLISGIFKIGLDEYDSGFAYSSLDFVRKSFDEKEGADFVELSLNHNGNQTFSKILKNDMPQLKIQTWQELYPALVSSLKLEKYVMFLIIALISLVASMNMISLLFLQIQQKKRNIAIFKAMGMASKTIVFIFLWVGMLITLLAVSFGLSLAVMIGYILEKYPFITLPDVYYVSHLPARVELSIVLIVFLCTILLGFIATLIPAIRVRKLNITNVLRME